MATETYSQVLSYVNTVTAAYITLNVKAVATAIAPAVTSLLAVYVMLWGYALMRGGVNEPMLDGLQRISKMVIILAIAFQWASYNKYIVDTFTVQPFYMGQAFEGATNSKDMFGSLDSILDHGFQTGKKFWDQGGILLGDFGMYMLAILVWGQTIVVTAYACFLIVGAKISLAVLIAVGPIFICSLLFQATQDFFSRWIQQLANYALIIILTIAMDVLVMTLFDRAASGSSRITSTAQVNQLFPFLVTGAVSLLCLAQIPSKAAGLAGGIQFNSYGAGRLVTRALNRHLQSLMPRRRQGGNPGGPRKRPRGGSIRT